MRHWMLFFLTETGSRYEVDEAGRRVRRLASEGSGASARVSWEWRGYRDIWVAEGTCAMIVWGDDVPALEPGGDPGDMMKTTVTSRVVSVLRWPASPGVA